MKKAAAFASVVCLSLVLSIPAFANQEQTNQGTQVRFVVNQTNGNLNTNNGNVTGNQNTTAAKGDGNYRAQAVGDNDRDTNWSWLGLLGLLGLAGLRKKSHERS
ncbi:hypothetical protein PAECIP111892_00826 [Paenibacillus auburnensis]|uniref:MYXO-CTERM domain-containing protein n=1 Tax=Paenibacillus auburnensis TaxID=2905649 RepID=A0ABM9BR14_9BACL|nr:WGxxGxxG family protein [Paenibacillus auburnensis]CAH1192029.1 hypothetical protein PAECIP111892_00826 [Paenibacillus auburnensis]